MKKLTWKQVIASAANRLLRRMRAEVVRYDPWDKTFKECIERAKRENRDPNEVLEEKWSGTVPLLKAYIYPHFRDGHTACEIGAGTARFSRHIFSRCAKLYLVDNSSFVCNFLKGYFKNHSNVEVIYCRDCRLPRISSESVDLLFSFGTFVHLDIEQFYGYLWEASRVLRHDGFAVIHYANIMSPQDYKLFKDYLPSNFNRSTFRFHHPEKIRKIAEDLGLEVVKETPIETALPFVVELRKRARS